MTEEEIKQQLITSFNLWTTQVKRLIVSSTNYVKNVLNTDKLNGYTLAQLIAIIRAEVKVHEDNNNNPHLDDLAKLGGMTKEAYTSLVADRFPKDGVPVSKIPRVVPGFLASDQLPLPATAIIYNGRRLTVPARTLTLGTAAVQYIKVVVTGTKAEATPVFMVATTQTETLSTIIIGTVTYSNGSYVVDMLEVVRIGYAAIRTTPRGRSIPASTGTAAAPGTIDSNWIS